MKRNFAVRTVRNGTIRIYGHRFKPNEQRHRYDGRLEGMRLAFGLYWIGDEFQTDFVSLWGTEAMYREKDRERFAFLFRTQPNLVGCHFYWEWWDNVNRKNIVDSVPVSDGLSRNVVGLL